MKHKHNAGFSLIEVLVAMAVLGVVVIPVCSSLILSFRINAKSDAMLQAQLAVSSAVETLMAEGIDPDAAGVEDYGKTEETDRFPDAVIEAVQQTDDDSNPLPYYEVTVTDNNGLVTVTTYIRQQGGGS